MSTTCSQDRESPPYGGNMARRKSGMGKGCFWVEGRGWFLCHRRVREVRGGTPVIAHSPLVKKRCALGCRCEGKCRGNCRVTMRQRRRPLVDFSSRRGRVAVFRWGKAPLPPPPRGGTALEGWHRVGRLVGWGEGWRISRRFSSLASSIL